MTLEQVRKIQTTEQLAQAVRHYAATAEQITIGEAYAMQRTIMQTAERLGVSVEQLRELAKQGAGL